MRLERYAIVLGLLVALFIPILSEGWNGMLNLIIDWGGAVFARGLPLESHNQSFAALLHHYLSGNPTAVLSEGGQPLYFGEPWLSSYQIILLSFFWTASSVGVLLGWIISGSKPNANRWIAVTIGLLIIPSHLIWKPYFVMSIPLAILIVHQCVQDKRSLSVGTVLLLFVGINLTGFDFVGHQWAAHFEAASLMLIAHLFMIGLAMRNGPDSQQQPQ